ncbi:acyltransferase/acetyltransferase [Candidatus Arthromitus sp. SFB-mouse-Japan]|uniref:acyltransferase family protein n=1 Tax=Candidatus Arthromitus sp. SFB-mouse TaxID=49118 RepID=UPI00021B7FFF|nr:acyltransferase [Candidatus Arthromitus sp. SFB-mouse]BAK55826.1 acyltransferase/acetyltransferase [Candidatus Arthromitus sp. SFB-mouse-Japan]
MISKKQQSNITLIEFSYLRGFGIFLVVLGHSFPYIKDINTPIYNYIHSLIYSFHMPLFFMISGFFANKLFKIKSLKDFKSFILSKFKKLLIPYFIISTLTIPIKLILNKFSERPLVLSETIKDILFFPWNNPIIFFWFIYVLFFMFLFAPVLIKINKYLVLTILLAMSILTIDNIEFLAISTILKYYIFFFIGLYIYPVYMNYRNKILNINLKQYRNILFILIPLILFLLNFNIDYNSLNVFYKYLTNILFILKSLLGIYVSFIICILLYKFRHIKLVSNTFDTLNKYSFDIYLLSWFPQIFTRILLLQLLNLNYNLVVIISFLIGFSPIIVSKFILRKSNILKKFILGI